MELYRSVYSPPCVPPVPPVPSCNWSPEPLVPLYRAAMHRRSARARRIYVCRSSRNKRPHRSAPCIRRRPCKWVACHQRAHVGSYEEADLASLGRIKHAEQRCTDAALVLDASTRVAAAAISGLIDLHFAFVVDHANGLHAINVLMLGLTRKLTLRASGGSNTPSSDTQTQRSC